MEYRQLGGTGVRVSPLCLGAMNWNHSNVEEGVASIHAALDRGINFIDTANVYSRGQSEEVVGKALHGRRDNVVLATKVHGAMGDDTNQHGNGRRHIILECEASLRRLGTDWIDLYQLHRPDPTTPIQESLLALDELVRAGKVRYVGFSTFPAWQTMEALALADRRNLHSAPVCEQPPYSILERRIEVELIPMAIKHGIGIIPWSPLASGLLTGKYSDGIPAGSRFGSFAGIAERPDFQAGVEAVRALSKIASGAGLTTTALALAWLIGRPGVTAPIIGPKDRKQLGENLAALDVTLDASVLSAVDEIAPPAKAIFPYG